MVVFIEYKKMPIIQTTWRERWEGFDSGLIACWLRGIEKAQENTQLERACLNGELPPLPWKGGFAKKTKQKMKYGSLYYLAMWQGIRRENLQIDTSQETQIQCTKTKRSTIFTPDLKKLSHE